MDQAVFDELQQTLAKRGPDAAIEQLCATLRERKDYGSLFYALLMKKRYELGLSPVPSGASQDIPEAKQAPYEDAIRQAGRLVGQLYLDQGDIPRAWAYFRMLGENEPIVKAIEQVQPAEGDDVQQLIEIAFHHGVHPRKGFDLLLERFGLCSAITTASSGEYPHPPEVRNYCVQKLVRALYAELASRLAADIVQKEGKAPPASPGKDSASVRELMAGRDWLFSDDFYHIDVSHLNAVLQMCLQMPPCEELNLARELCAYGKKLSPRFQYPSDPPFENQYHDHAVFLDIIAGENVEEGIAHFRSKVENADPDTVGTAPAEILVSLLLRLNRPQEALTIARKHLLHDDNRPLSCPSIPELCQKANDYQALTEVAREKGDTVHFMAGLLAVNGR